MLAPTNLFMGAPPLDHPRRLGSSTTGAERVSSTAHETLMRMAATDLQQRVAAHRWYHSIDLGSGVVTRGTDDTPVRLAQLQLPGSLAGQTVLDIGAWDGFFSFECERRGAARVVAADYYSWHGSGWGTKAGFTLAREVLGSKVEDIDIDVMDLAPERVGTFDLVLFLGVLYHLRHPYLALERVSSVVGDR